MSTWNFKEWRKKLGYTQSEASEQLGLSRATVQYWEAELRPVPLGVELACRQLLRRWKQRAEFGPVTLLYADHPIWQEGSPPCGVRLLRCERHPDNKSAIKRAVWLTATMVLVTPLILEDDGDVIWSGQELLRECDACKQSARNNKDTINEGDSTLSLPQEDDA